MIIYIALNEGMEACHHLGVFEELDYAKAVKLANVIDVWSNIYDGSTGEFKSQGHYFRHDEDEGGWWEFAAGHGSCFGNPYLEGCRCGE